MCFIRPHNGVRDCNCIKVTTLFIVLLHHFRVALCKKSSPLTNRVLAVLHTQCSVTLSSVCSGCVHTLVFSDFFVRSKCMYVCIYIYICVCVCVCVCNCGRLYMLRMTLPLNRNTAYTHYYTAVQCSAVLHCHLVAVLLYTAVLLSTLHCTEVLRCG